jgi:hypothetical protein
LPYAFSNPQFEIRNPKFSSLCPILYALYNPPFWPSSCF